MTVEQPQQQAKRPLALLLSPRVDRLNQFLNTIRSFPETQPMFKGLDFDLQATTFDMARDRLKTGIEGREHNILIIDGAAALKMNRKDLDRLRVESLRGRLLVVMGMADIDKERSALANLGIIRIMPPHGPGDDIMAQFTGAVRDAKTAQAEIAAQAQQEVAVVQPTVIVQGETPGMLPDSGVVVVHSTKGGAGKSSIAANIAWGLSNTGRATIILDLNPDGAHVDQEFWAFLKDAYDSRDDLLDYKGIRSLAYSINHQAVNSIDHDALNRAIAEVVMASDGTQHLDLLPGVADQTDYRIGEVSADASVAKLLQKSGWVDNLIAELRKPRSYNSYRYIVIDSGTNRYTAPALAAINRADVFVLVVDASSPNSVADEALAMRHLLDPNRSSAVSITPQRILVINKLKSPAESPYAPRFEQVRKEFDFFEPTEVIAIPNNAVAFDYANMKKKPVLATFDLSDDVVPARVELMRLVNVLARVYQGNQPPKRRGIGGLFRRG